MEHSDQQAELEAAAMLVASRPGPSLSFQAELERSLFPERRRAPRRFVVALASVGALVAVVLSAALIGGGPLAPRGGGAATADPACRTVYVTRVAPVGQVVERADGSVTVETTRRPVTRAERRCR